jgi:hypothetical protein
VLIDRRTLSRHFPWILLTLGLLLGSVAWYLLDWPDRSRWQGGSSRPGLGLGILAGLIFLFEFLYWPRRTRWFRAWRVGRAETWLNAHIWLGLLTLPLVLMHSGFQWGGSFTTLFSLVYLAVFVSGVCGLLLQQVIPRLLLEEVPQETIYSQIEQVLAQHIADAERLLARLRDEPTSGGTAGEAIANDAAPLRIGSARKVGTMRQKVRSFGDATEQTAEIAALDQAWRGEIRPYLASLQHVSPRLATAARAAEYFAELEQRSEAAARPAVQFVAAACEKRRQLARQQRLHYWLHSWLAIHLPLSIALMLLLVVHVFTALKFGLNLWGW